MTADAKLLADEIEREDKSTFSEEEYGLIVEALRTFGLRREASQRPDRDDVLAEVERRLHDCYNLQRASAWPHVEGVARAERIVREMRAERQYVPNEPTTGDKQ